MLKIAISVIIALASFNLAISKDTDTIFSQAFGNPGNKAVVFLHGGPGGNSFLFRVGCAEALAKLGYYVIVYDRGGCGHSAKVHSQYTFEQALDGIDSLYLKYKFHKSILIGEDFGGLLALLYAKHSPEKVSGILLISTPLKFEDIYKNIIARSKEIYTEQGSPDLDLIKQLDDIDHSSYEYARQANMHAQSNSLLSTPNPDEKAIVIYQLLSRDTDIDMMQKTTVEPLKGFIGNENFPKIDISLLINEIKNKIKLTTIYGADDKTFPQNYLEKIKDVVGAGNFHVFPRCGHSCYIDARLQFFDVLKNFEKE